MWHARFSRRDFIEFWLGSNKTLDGRIKRAHGLITADRATSEINAYWDREPGEGYYLPSLLVIPNGDSNELLTAINSSPQALAPVTAFCRVLTQKEAEAYFSSPPMDLADDALPVAVALAMAEAVTHSEGRINWRQLSPAACKRTLSYAWGRALVARVPADSLEQLPVRWLDSYAVINSLSHADLIRHTVAGAIGPLNVYAQLAAGLPPKGKPGALAYSIFRRDKVALDRAWSDISKDLPNVSLDSFSQSNREERGGYLQYALRKASGPIADEAASAACAFIATQVAPGSLEHLDLLRVSGNPSVVFWYALFAALQAPAEVMAAQGGLGYRVYRDIAKSEEHLAAPSADIAYSELKVFERSGVEGFSKKLGHSGEIEVELVPLVTSSFTYSSRTKSSRTDPSLFQESELYRSAQKNAQTKAHLEQIIASLIQLTNEIPDPEPNGYSPSSFSRKSTRKGK